jgi:hypothetical protein
MRRNSIKKSLITFCWFFVAVSLTGCLELHHGYYIADKTPGWTLARNEGVNCFYFPNKSKSKWFILIAGKCKGAIDVSINFTDKAFTDKYIAEKFNGQHGIWNHVVFSTNHIRLFSDGQKTESRIPLEELATPFGKRISLGGSTNFWLSIPALMIDEVESPELTTHIEWTDRSYAVEIPLQ